MNTASIHPVKTIWKITLCDLLTLLVCFFVLLVSRLDGTKNAFNRNGSKDVESSTPNIELAIAAREFLPASGMASKRLVNRLKRLKKGLKISAPSIALRWCVGDLASREGRALVRGTSSILRQLFGTSSSAAQVKIDMQVCPKDWSNRLFIRTLNFNG